MEHSYSQIGQDKKVFEFYNSKKEGYFVEVGAYDGVALSNTLALERQLGWKGICVEPLTTRFVNLVTNRTAHCCDMAVYHSTGLDVSFDVEGDFGMLSGINTHLDAHRATVNKNKKTITVKTISLNDLLEKYNAPEFIEYMSLDTEGSEYEILRTLDFKKWKFGLIDVEHNHIEPRRSMINRLLCNNGYTYMGANHFDDCYKLTSLEPKAYSSL